MFLLDILSLRRCPLGTFFHMHIKNFSTSFHGNVIKRVYVWVVIRTNTLKSLKKNEWMNGMPDKLFAFFCSKKIDKFKWKFKFKSEFFAPSWNAPLNRKWYHLYVLLSKYYTKCTITFNISTNGWTQGARKQTYKLKVLKTHSKFSSIW